MTRAEQNATECYDPSTREFDWDQYQQMCDIADHWDCDE